MKQTILIIAIILFSIIGGGIGAYGVLTFLGISSPDTTSLQLSPQRGESELQDSVASSLLSGDKGETERSDNFEVEAEKNGERGQTDLVSLENTITQTVSTIAPSVVSIVIKRDLVIYRSDPYGFFQRPTGTVSRQVGGGSGFFVKDDGTILTNKHVVQDTSAEYTVILNTGEEYDAQVIALDPVNDLAIIKIDDQSRSFTALPISENLEDTQIGDFGIAVGNALAELQNSVSLGIVSGKNRTIQAGGGSLSGLLQTDAAINPGNSGGPLINLTGEVIAINTAIASNSNGIGFAYGLTQDRVDYMLESISESGRIMRPFIGINYIPNSQGVANQLGLASNQGVYIIDEAESVVEGSSAELAGLEPGDIILEVDDKQIGTNITLSNIIQNSLPGDVLELKVLKKDGEERIINLELGAI